uniref:C2H2-type domain-containing protein n=1 Tax=Lutzomyia longipalpis TaxID=7200 RepID=A0A1B0CV32_LUTLO
AKRALQEQSQKASKPTAVTTSVVTSAAAAVVPPKVATKNHPRIKYSMKQPVPVSMHKPINKFELLNFSLSRKYGKQFGEAAGALLGGAATVGGVSVGGGGSAASAAPNTTTASGGASTLSVIETEIAKVPASIIIAPNSNKSSNINEDLQSSIMGDLSNYEIDDIELPDGTQIGFSDSTTDSIERDQTRADSNYESRSADDTKFAFIEGRPLQNYEFSQSDSNDDGGRQYICRHCGKKYRWKSTLRRHENVECGGKEPMHQCPHCAYRAKQRGNLGVHIRKHHSEMPQLETRRKHRSSGRHSTGRLDERFSGKWNKTSAEDLSITRIAGLTWDQWNARLAMPLVTQLREGVHPLVFPTDLSVNQEGGGKGDLNPGFSCPDCGRLYKLKSSLRNHQKWECGKEPQFQCPFCVYRAKQKMHIGRHMERMHKEKFIKLEHDKDMKLEEGSGNGLGGGLTMIKLEPTSPTNTPPHYTSFNYNLNITNPPTWTKRADNPPPPLWRTTCVKSNAKTGIRSIIIKRQPVFGVDESKPPTPSGQQGERQGTTPNAGDFNNSAIRVKKEEQLLSQDDILYIGGEKPWICRNCNRNYKWKNSLKCHLKNECGLPPKYFCSRMCGYKTNIHSNLKRHLNSKFCKNRDLIKAENMA